MTRDAFRDEIKLKLTGGVLDLEIDDTNLDKIINSGLRELTRYMDTPVFQTIPYEKCIDLQKRGFGHVNKIVRVFRTSGVTKGDAISDDPMVISQWQMIGGLGNLYNFQDSMDNYLAWNTLLRLRNTTSTDLNHIFDEKDQKLYINVSTNVPSELTIAYVPTYTEVEDIRDDYWVDTLMQLCVALTKIALGRIRSRYTQTGALWTQDGATLLQEGLDEYKTLQEYLKNNTNIAVAID